MLSSNEIKSALEDVLVDVRGEEFFTGFSRVELDSRAVDSESLFVALKGERFDAHDFLSGAAAAGARVFIVERDFDADAARFIVSDSRRALGLLARFWRLKLGTRIVAVAGSNGKTTTTQMCARILEKAFGEAAHSTRGNFNNEIGCAKTLLALRPEHEAAVVEVGMNHPGEMAVLADMVRPNAAVMTNAQREHQEFIHSVREAAYENGMIIPALAEGGVFLCPVDDECADVWRSLALASRKRVLGYSAFGTKTDVCIEEGVLSSPFGSFKADFCFNGRHLRHDAAAAAAATLSIGADPAAVGSALREFRPLKGRGESTKTRNGLWTVADESYNANPDSVRAAIDVLSEGGGRKIFLLGDMGEVGENGPAFHKEVGAYAKSKGIDVLATLGPLSKLAGEAFGEGSVHFDDRDELAEWLRALPNEELSISVKASRSMHFEEFVDVLIN